MELVLFLIAAGIIFYLYKTFQVYLSNPIASNEHNALQFQQQEVIEVKPPLTPKEKLRNTEYGILTRILGKLSFVDNESCVLEEKLVQGIINDMAQDSDTPRELFLEIYKEAKDEDIQELAELFCAETVGQYKKRLKAVEFMFALSYADGDFSQEEEDAIINVAAILEIENDDFNHLYDTFKDINSSHVPMTRDEAMQILGVSENYTEEELNSKYNAIFERNRQNIFDPKNLTRSYNENGGQELKRVSEAYTLLLQDLNKSSS